MAQNIFPTQLPLLYSHSGCGPVVCMYSLHDNLYHVIATTLHHVCHVMLCHVLLQEKKEMERQLLEACRTGNLPNVKKLCGVVDASKVRDNSYFRPTPLHLAAEYVMHLIWCIMLTYSTGRYQNSIMI